MASESVQGRLLLNAFLDEVKAVVDSSNVDRH